MYKSFAEKGLSFLQHIYVYDFNLDARETTADVNYNDRSGVYRIWFLEFEGFTCAYTLIDN